MVSQHRLVSSIYPALAMSRTVFGLKTKGLGRIAGHLQRE